MKITTETLPDRQLYLTIEVDEDQTKKAMQRASRQIAKQVNIPGFRKGKAPYELIIQRYGEDTVRKEAAEAIVEKVYRDAIAQEKIEPYMPGQLEEIELTPITFQFTISLPPVLNLGDYRNYRLKARKARVFKKDIQQAMEEIRVQNTIFNPAERPVTKDDGATINLVAQTTKGVTFLQQEEIRVILEDDGNEPAPGFTDAIIGMEADEERTFTLILPDDFPEEELRGQEAEFTVKMLEVYESILPELDDDLARTVGNYESLKELEKETKEQLRQATQQEIDQEYTEQVINDTLERAEIEYPPIMLEEEIDGAVKEFEQAVKRELKLSLDDFLRYQNKTIEQQREEFEPRATSRLRQALMLGEVVTLEELAIDEEEIDAQIEEIIAPFGDRADEMRKALGSRENRAGIHSRLLAGKAVERLIAIAKGEAPELSSAEEQENEEAESATEEGEA
ncbi:MAG: trigger factor [Chloroflexi bacterium]|nr:trigger factor [Chloroflexota bacterium]